MGNIGGMRQVQIQAGKDRVQSVPGRQLGQRKKPGDPEVPCGEESGGDAEREKE